MGRFGVPKGGLIAWGSAVLLGVSAATIIPVAAETQGTNAASVGLNDWSRALRSRGVRSLLLGAGS